MNADLGEGEASSSPHADIVERLLEYPQASRGDRGRAPAFGEMRDAPEQEVEARQPGPNAQAERGSEPGWDAIAPGPTGAEEREPEPPDVRRLRERIERLDETLARISAMLPLLRPWRRRGVGSMTPPRSA